MRVVRHAVVPALWTIAAVCIAMEPASAQAPQPIDCSYDECALRIKQSFFGGSDLVRGVGDDKVDGLGAFIGSLDGAFSGSPTAQDLAARYRSRHNTGSVFGLLGTVAVTVAIYTLDWDTQSADDTSAGLLLGGTAFLLTGAIIQSTGRDYLNQAIWEYNRALAP